MTELRPRSHLDYERQPDVEDEASFLTYAVDIVYGATLARAGAALAAGASTALFGAAGLAGPIGEWLDRNAGAAGLLSLPTRADLESALYQDGRAYGRADLAAGPRAYILELRERLPRASAHVLEDLDVVINADDGAAATLLLLLRQAHAADQRFLALLPADLRLPPSWASLFPVQLAMPPLARDSLWQLLRYSEVKNLLATPTLTPSLQTRLYHRVALLNLQEFRQAVRALVAWPDGPASSPGIALDRLADWLAPERRADWPSGVDRQALHPALAEQVAAPLRSFSRDLDPAALAAAERSFARAFLLRGEHAAGRAQIAALVESLDLGLIRVSGYELAALTAAEFGAVDDLVERTRRAAPAALWIDALEDAVAAGEPTAALRRLVGRWSRRRPSEASLLLATSAASLPANLLSHFTEILL